MTIEVADTSPLINECKTIAENCLYTAQAHFETARSRDGLRIWVIVLPACFAALAALVAFVHPDIWPSKAHNELLKATCDAIAVLSSTMTAVAVFVGVDRQAAGHVQAGNAFTALRHDARALHETFSPNLSPSQLSCRVQSLHERYLSLCQATEITDKSAFNKVREEIKGGIHLMDFKNTQQQIESSGAGQESVTDYGNAK